MNSDGEKIRGMDYVADFTYMDGNTLVIEDVKSEATRKDKVYQLKKKLMADKGFTITEVYGGSYGSFNEGKRRSFLQGV